VEFDTSPSSATTSPRLGSDGRQRLAVRLPRGDLVAELVRRQLGAG
jgi:hypothetical protein